MNSERENFTMSGGGASAGGWVPAFADETSSGIREITLMTRHFTDRKVFLTGEVTDRMANDFVSQMLYLSQSSEPADIYINSPGGAVSAGLVIYDMLQACKFPVNLYCIGEAASMGAVILAGGQKGRRFILPHSRVMIHEPLIRGGVGGAATSIRKTAESIMETKMLINRLLAKHTGKTEEQIDEATSYDNYMNSDEAIAFGIADEIKTPF